MEASFSQWNEGNELNVLQRNKGQWKGYETNAENPEYKLDPACLNP